MESGRVSCLCLLVYSPSLNLPNQSLKEKEIDLQGGLELFLESRPASFWNNLESRSKLSIVKAVSLIYIFNESKEQILGTNKNWSESGKESSQTNLITSQRYVLVSYVCCTIGNWKPKDNSDDIPFSQKAH